VDVLPVECRIYRLDHLPSLLHVCTLIETLIENGIIAPKWCHYPRADTWRLSRGPHGRLRTARSPENREEIALVRTELRATMPNTLFLAPGFGS
jgi:hypothetical protein